MKVLLIFFKNKARGLLWKILLLLSSMAILISMIDLLAYSHYYKYKIYSSYERYALLYNGEVDMDETIIYCDNNVLCYLSATETAPINVEFFMQKDGADCDIIDNMYREKLADNEIVVSASTAKQYNIKKGDTLYLDVAHSLIKVEFIVKEVINDIPSLFGNSSRYGAIIGYSDVYCNSVGYQTLLFYDGELQDLTFGPNFAKYTNLAEVSLKELFIFLSFFAVYVLLLVFVLLLLLNNQEKDIRSGILKLKRQGFSLKLCLLIKVLFNLFILLPCTLIPLIIYNLLDGGKMIFSVNCVMCIIIGLIEFLKDCKSYGGGKYITNENLRG